MMIVKCLNRGPQKGVQKGGSFEGGTPGGVQKKGVP